MIVTPFAGAGDGNITGNATDCPSATVVPVGRMIAPKTCTFTVAVALAIPGTLLVAVIVVDPPDTPVTGTSTEVALGGKVTEDSTVATPALEDARFTTRPPDGADGDRVNVRFWVLVPLRFKVPDGKLSAAAT